VSRCGPAALLTWNDTGRIRPRDRSRAVRTRVRPSRVSPTPGTVSHGPCST
jgi:hypothetical protein